MSNIDEVLDKTVDTLAGMGDKVFLFGLGGSGKSVSAISVLKMLEDKPDLKVRVLITETNALAAIRTGLLVHKIELQPGQLGYYRPAYSIKGGFRKQKQKLVNSFLDVSTKEALKRQPGASRSIGSNFLRTYSALENFKGIDVLTGKALEDGGVEDWGLDYVLVIDSLTGMINQLIETVKGDTVLSSQETYGRVQSVLEEEILIPLTQVVTCHLLLLCHPKTTPDPRIKQKKPSPKEEDTRIYVTCPKTYGKALDGTFNSLASDVIYAYNKGSRYLWTNDRDGILTVSRKIPMSDKLMPDFSLYNLFNTTAGGDDKQTT